MVTEIIVGGLIHHLTFLSEEYKQTSFQKNLIVKSNNINVLIGNNSIGRPIFGAAYDFRTNENVAFKVGGYIQDSSEFKYVRFRHEDFVPVVGLEIHKNIYNNFGVTGIITPLLGFLGISYKIKD